MSLPSTADLSPANFAIVMATGILGVASHQQGHAALADALLAVAALSWVAISAMSLARIARHPDRILADLRSHQRAPGFLAGVAGTSVLAGLWLLSGLPPGVSMLLAVLAALLWVLFTYGMLVALTLQPDKPPLADGISGAWLLIVVATQSIAVVSVLIGAGAQQPLRLALNFVALAMWMCGGMLYVWVIALIFYRYAFFRFSPQDLAPTYWINMGAMAISALAGGLLVQHSEGAPFLLGLLPLLKGVTLMYWAVGTWWIPLLVALAVWRYVARRYPLRYDVGYWGAVFPLGMYSAATQQMSLVLGLDFLQPLARGFFVVACIAWLLTAAGLAWKLARRAGASSAGEPAN